MVEWSSEEMGNGERKILNPEQGTRNDGRAVLRGGYFLWMEIGRVVEWGRETREGKRENEQKL